MRLVNEAFNGGTSSSGFNGQISGEIWDKLEHMLEVSNSLLLIFIFPKLGLCLTYYRNKLTNN